jgi:flavin-dependent dehydrogenase
MARTDTSQHDAIVIGGGPGGSSAARTLAADGLDVLLLERQRFPRFHIGESMLAYGAVLMRRLGIADDLERIGFPFKWGAEFIQRDGRYQRVDFTEQGGGRRLTTFQVERSEFDEVLLREAEGRGATVKEEAHVGGVLTDDGGRIVGVRYTHEGRPREARARMVLDASGRAGVVTNQHLGARVLNPKLRTVAVFKHFGDVDESNNPGVRGDIQIGSHEDGWVWAIPIRADKLSVGAVTKPETLRGADRERLFEEHVSRVPRIRQRIEDATATTELKAENDFSYFTETVAGEGFLVVGDAGCFVDPIFSAGVFMALATGIRAGEVTLDVLSGRLPETEARQRYTRFYKTGYDTYFRVIYAYYEHECSIGKYLRSTGVRVETEWIARLLSGDYWSRKNPLAERLREDDRYRTFAPFEPLYGCPVYPDLDAAEPEGSALGAPFMAGAGGRA